MDDTAPHDPDPPVDLTGEAAELTDEAAELRPLRLALTAVLAGVPVAAASRQPELAVALLALAGCGLFLLRRIPECLRGQRAAIVTYPEVERVLKLILIAVGAGLALFAQLLFVHPAFPGGGRPGANAAAAIATLRNLAAAQAQCQASGAIDRDGDGVGEYGYFRDLAGGRLQPPALSGAFAKVVPLVDADGRPRGGVVRRSGYLYQLFLPAADGLGLPEPAAGDDPAPIDPDRAERAWCCYAWPISYGNSGKRAFFIDQTGVLLTSNNRTFYSGNGRSPSFGAAFRRGQRALLGSSIAQDASGQDRQFWKTVR